VVALLGLELLFQGDGGLVPDGRGQWAHELLKALEQLFLGRLECLDAGLELSAGFGVVRPRQLFLRLSQPPVYLVQRIEVLFESAGRLPGILDGAWG